jgi:hypothetical protein
MVLDVVMGLMAKGSSPQKQGNSIVHFPVPQQVILNQQIAR